MASALIFPKIDGFERGGGDLGRSLTLAAFVARNGPPDHFVRLAANRASPCPPAVIREANAYGKRPDFSQMDGYERGPVTSAARLCSRRSLLEMVRRTISFALRRTAPHPVGRR